MTYYVHDFVTLYNYNSKLLTIWMIHEILALNLVC